MRNLLVALLLMSLSASAFAFNEITITGQSAKYLVSMMQSSQNRGVKVTADKSLLGSRVDVYTYSNLIQCRLKHGWVLETAKCKLPGTNYYDIQGMHMVNFSSDDFSQSVSALNATINLSRNLVFRGASASRIYLVLSQLNGQDPTLRGMSGQTKILKNNFDAVTNQEFYCQVVHGRVLGDSYKCVMTNVTIADSNAPTEIITDTKKNDTKNSKKDDSNRK